MIFRPDIQILRGLSVLFVVLYHLDLKYLQSGFLGVDIFFVISGFLMAVLYNNDQKLTFLSKRAKRLLPAYFIVIIMTLIVAFLVTTPNETTQVTLQAKFASLFSSNIGFWLENSYFSKAEFSPLLHLWSLGVEIQFYLIIPILYWFFSKSKLFLPIILILSISLCFIVLEISPKTSFFMMPLRLWEFLIGYSAAFYFTNKGSVKYSNYSYIGLFSLCILVLIPFMKVDGEAQDVFLGHPGIYALMVSIATFGVLTFGLPNTIIKSKLSKIFTTLGDYSYSIYLAHFPIIVLYLSKPFEGTNLKTENVFDLFYILAMVLVCSILLYNLVEKRSKNLSLKYILVSPIVVILLLSITLPYIQLQKTPIKEQYIFNAFTDRSPYRCGKIFRILNPAELSCELTNTKKEHQKRFMLIGNSHADSIRTSFTEVANEKGVSLFFIVANEPLMKGGIPLEIIQDEILQKQIETIILHFSPRSLSIKMINDITLFADKNGIKVAYIDPVPMWKKHIPQAMYSELVNDTPASNQTKAEYLEYNKELFSGIEKLNMSNFQRFEIADYLCQPNCEYSSPEGKPYYFDTEHLTITGSAQLKKVFRDVLH